MLRHQLEVIDIDDVFEEMIAPTKARHSKSRIAERRMPLGEISNKQIKPARSHVSVMKLPSFPNTANPIANPVPRKRKRMGGVSDVYDVAVKTQNKVIKNEISPWSCYVEVGTNVKKRARMLSNTTSNRPDLCLKGSCFTGDTVNETTTPPYGHESPTSLKFKYDKTPLKSSKKKYLKKQRSRKSPKQPLKKNSSNSDGLVVFNMFLKNLESFNNDVCEPTSFYTSEPKDDSSVKVSGFEMFLKKLENDMALRNLGNHENDVSKSIKNCSTKNYSKSSSGYSPGFSPSVTSTPQLSRVYSNSPKPSSAGYFSKPSTNASNIFQFDVDSLYGSGSTKDMVLTSDIEEGVMSSNQIRFLNAMEQRVKGGSDDGFSETVLENHVEFESSSLVQAIKKIHIKEQRFLQSNLPTIESLGKPKATSSPLKRTRRSRETRRNMWRPWC